MNQPFNRSPSDIQIHDLSDMAPADAYAETQCRSAISDGDILLLQASAIAVLMGAWPVLVHGVLEGFHQLEEGVSLDSFDNGRYAKSAEMVRLKILDAN